MTTKLATESVAKQRATVLAEMTPPLQEVAKDFELQFQKGNAGLITVWYNLGVRLATIIKDEAEYGTGAVKQLAKYFQISDTTLYNLRNLVTEFPDKQRVQDLSRKPMANGKLLSLEHFFKLMQVKEKKDQNRLLDQIFEKSWSAAQLEDELKSVKTKNARQGGRKPKMPTSPIGGLSKVYSLSNQLNNLEGILAKSVFDAIESLPPDQVTPNLLERLNTTYNAVILTKEKAQHITEELEGNIKRVEEVLADRKLAGESVDTGSKKPKAKGKKPKAKPKKQKSGKASSNGKAKTAATANA